MTAAIAIQYDEALPQKVVLESAGPPPNTTVIYPPEQQPTQFPLSITDDSGTTTAFAVSPQRIVSLSPGLTEITFAVGAGDRLVAVDTYSDFPPEAKSVQPRLTTFPSPSIETIVGLKPDLVLSLADRDEDIAQIRRQGIPVLKLFPKDFDAAVRAIQTLGQLYGVPDVTNDIAIDMDLRSRAQVIVNATNGSGLAAATAS